MITLYGARITLKKIAIDFEADYKTMSQDNQRYFGDWVSYEGYHDVGYYLGSRFVRFILDYDSFNNVISYDINKVKSMYYKFIETL